MSVHYLVDFENVHESGLYGLYSLSAADCVYIFHTSASDKISLSSLDDVQAWVKVIMVPPGKQSLDMHLGSFLGYLIGKEETPDTKYAIVSHDNDYRGISEFWNRTYQMRDKVQCIHGMRFALGNSNAFDPAPVTALPEDNASERIAIHEYIIRAFTKHGVVGLNGMPCMLVSELCTLLNGLPEYNNARKRLGKKPMQYLSDECQDILWIKRQWMQDWAYLVAGKTSSTPVRSDVEAPSQAVPDESILEEQEPDIMDLVALNIDDEQMVSDIPVEESIPAAEDEITSESQPEKEPAAAVTETEDPAEPDLFAAAMECFQKADNASRNVNGHVRASVLRDELLTIPTFRAALKESGLKPIAFLQQSLSDEFTIYREKGIYWVSISDPHEAKMAERKRDFYERSFCNIQKQLSNAGLNREVVDEIANIFMRSKAAVEPRKVIHNLLCQRFGSKTGSQYYRKAVKYTCI